jgi:predicted Zn-dependent peptidase
LQGSASLLPRAIALLIAALLHADAADWRSVVAGITLERHAMPIRQLLANCSELFRRQPVDTDRLDLVALQQRYRQVRVEALGVGLDAVGQQQVEALFSEVLPLPVSARLASTAAGQHWRTLAAEGESALLLFCPQPDDSALTEAGWRVLGHLHQGAFYQRLRSELQLGYAVFCSYRQIQGRRGLLFGVQSPSCSGAAIFEHIQAFLQERNACLLELNQAALACVTEALSRQWQVQSHSCEGLAEQAWQAHLAGLSAEHGDTVQLALQELDPDAVLQAQQALSQAVGGWYVLSNEAQPC